VNKPGAGLFGSDRAVVGVLAALWVLAALFAGIRGEFVENDSWAYSRATEHFLATGHVERTPWTYAPIVTNVLIGALFAKVLGFSLSVLRLSTLVMGGLGMLTTYALARVLGHERRVAALVAATLGFGPLYLGLSYTFMTDIPYSAVATGSLVALSLGLMKRGVVWYLLGLFGAAAATLSRQTGVVLIVGLLATVALARIRTRRDLIVTAAIAAGLALLATFVERVLMGWSNFGVLRALTSAFLGSAPIYSVASHAFPSLICLGLLGLPLLVARAASGELKRVHVLAGLGLAALTLAFVLKKLATHPFYGNHFDRAGFGPIAIHCAAERPMMSSWLWWSLVVLGATSGGIAASVIFGWIAQVAWPQRRTHPEKMLLLVTTLLYLGPVMLRNPFFNRYLIPILPVWLIFFAPSFERREQARPLAAGVATAAVVGILSLLATRDYLGHLGLRQSLIDPLLSSGTSPAQIEAGFEFDGQRRYAVPGMLSPPEQDPNAWLLKRSNALTVSTASGWSYGERYLVSYCESVSGYHPVTSEARWRAIPPGTEKLYLLERNAATH